MSASQIKYIYKIVPDAYHGTELELAKKIVKENNFQHSRGDRPYLGEGIYFFEAALARSIKWATKKFKEGQIGVIKAVINLGSCLDLTNPDNIRLLRRLKNRLLQKLPVVSIPYVINACAVMYKVDTVRAAFPKETWRTEDDFPNYELIICVKNKNSITKITLVYEGLIQ